MTEPQDRLDSWKEIAAYLTRDIRTVQRWERTEGLPVHRHVHGERGSVYAFKAEIDAWRDARQPATDPLPPAPTPRGRTGPWILLAAAAAVILIGAGTAIWRGTRSNPAPTAPAAAAWDAPRLFDELTRDGGRVKAIRVGHGFHPIAIAPDDSEIYVGNTDDHTISVVDAVRETVVTTLEVHDPAAIAVAPDGGRIYAAQQRGDVIAIDRATRKMTRLRTPGRVLDFALSSDGRTLYLAGEFSGLVAMSTATGDTRTLSTLPCPRFIALSPDDRRLYVSYQCNGPGGRRGHDAIDVVDTATGTSVGPITGLARVGGRIVFVPDADQIWSDGANACVEPTYDHEGCPARGPIVNVVRASDRTPIVSLTPGGPSETVSLLGTFAGGRRTIVGRETAYVYSTLTLAPIESAPGPLYGRPVFSRDGTRAYLPIGRDDEILVLPIRRLPMPARGLTGRWLADGTLTDSAGLQHGLGEGRVGYTAGIVGRALTFAPGSDVRVDPAGNLGIDANPFTVSVWIKPSAAPAQPAETILDHSTVDDDGARGWRMWLTAEHHLAACFSDEAAGCVTHARTVTGSRVVDADRWHHAALVWAGDRARLFVDGVADGERALPHAVDARDQALRIGNDPAHRTTFRGAIDEIEVYERALTPAEIAGRATIRSAR